MGRAEKGKGGGKAVHKGAGENVPVPPLVRESSSPDAAPPPPPPAAEEVRARPKCRFALPLVRFIPDLAGDTAP